MTTEPMRPKDPTTARRAARRTALVFAGVAMTVYVAFVLLNVAAK